MNNSYLPSYARDPDSQDKSILITPDFAIGLVITIIFVLGVIACYQARYQSIHMRSVARTQSKHINDHT